MAVSKSFLIIEDEDFSISLEYTEELLILHLPKLTKMNKRVYILMERKLKEFGELFNTLGNNFFWVAINKDDTKLEKLALMLGFEYVGVGEGRNIFKKGTV